jgi:hypothetical protein
VNNAYWTLLFLIVLAAPVMASMDDNTLVIALPPPSIRPPVASPRSSALYQQSPVTARHEDTLDRPAPHSDVVPPPHSVGVVGRLGVAVWQGAPIYRGQDGGGRMVARVAQGTYLAIKSDYADWYGVLMVDGSLGWIRKSAVRLLDYNVVRPPSGTAGGEPRGSEGLGTGVLREAFKYLGVPYVWGGNGPSGLDCSGLVRNCFGQCGVRLPRRASEQAQVGQPVPLSLAALRPGDRLYFAVGRPTIDHTAIYLGNGYFIHASMSRGRVGVDHLSRPLYGQHLVAARRL